MNKTIMMGRIAKEIDVRTGQSGTAICSFTLAVDRPYIKDREKESDFFTVKAFGKTGEVINKYFSKGKRIMISGRVQNNNWTTSDGQKRYSTEIVVDEFWFLDKAEGGQVQTPAPFTPAPGYTPQVPNHAPAPAAQAQIADTYFEEVKDGDGLPF